MKQRDIEAVEEVLGTDDGLAAGRGILFCPSPQEIELVMRMLPQWTFDIIERKDWDLMDEYRTDEGYDMALMCNMFMYSTDPGRWLKNLSKTVGILIVQDVIRCPRMPDSEFGSDGDSSRFAFPSHGEFPRTAEYFDIEQAVGDGIKKVIFYSDNGNGDRDCRKFVAVLDTRSIK